MRVGCAKLTDAACWYSHATSFRHVSMWYCHWLQDADVLAEVLSRLDQDKRARVTALNCLHNATQQTPLSQVSWCHICRSQPCVLGARGHSPRSLCAPL